MRNFSIVEDENVDFRLIALLRENQFEVFSISESNFGIKDTDVLLLSNEKESFLITEDKDFGNLAIRNELAHQEILLTRRKSISAVEQSYLVLDILLNRSEDLLNHFSVLRDKKLAIRK